MGRDFVQSRRLFQRRAAPSVSALDEVSLTLEAGDCLALVGPNGAGKSTLLRVLATIISPTRGEATVNGYDVMREPEQVRASVGYTGDSDRSFFWPLTGLENLLFFGQLAGLTRNDALEESIRWIEKVGLSGAVETRVSGYSAGMRQRLGLARALLHRPAVLLLDEPTANLDAEYRQVAVEIIDEVREDGRGVLVATHDPGLVAAVATETLRLEAGRIVAPETVIRPVRYRLFLASPDNRAGQPDTLDVDDLGDGHALAAALSQAISSGRDVVSVEHGPS
ncbi:hypothetical protein BH23CHL2_BH23CHL2_06300 [soil metagenome]